jgi:peptidyl-prolyl cis-trans isomerase C
MKLPHGVVLGMATCLLLVGCGKDKEPKGQVVATVNGEEITAIDLRNEMGNFRAPDAATRKAAESAALEQIIQRKLLVGVAEERKLDKTPDYVQQKQRMEEAFLIRYWQQNVAKAVPPASKEEVASFIAAHPELYAERRVYVLDQIRSPLVRDPALINALKPLKSLPEVAALLTSKNIQFQQGEGQLDLLQTPPELAAQILKLPAGEVFVVPQGNIMTMNQIRETRIVPVTSEVATAHATQYLLAQRTQQAVQRDLGAALSAARKEKDAVQYAKAYEPQKAAPAAPAKK